MCYKVDRTKNRVKENNNMPKILVVDDEYRIRQIIRKYAEFEGYEVEEAVDGMQAIEVCRKNRYDLIIMDVMMPELDGFSACREIRKFCSSPIIMLSARGEEYDKIHGFELGSDDYVVKPFSPKELMMRVAASCSFTWFATRVLPSRARALSARSGAMISSATSAPSTPTSSCSERASALTASAL